MNIAGEFRQAALQGGELLRWWTAELKGLLPARWRQRWNRQRWELRLSSSGARLLRDGRAVTGAAWPLDGIDGTALRRHLRGSALGLVAERSICLVQRLSLPAAAAPALGSVLAFEVDRRTPFAAADVLIGHDRVDLSGGDALAVDMVCLPRRVVAGVLPGLAAAELRVAGLAAALGPRLITLPLDGDLAPRQQHGRLRAMTWAVGALALLAAVLVPVGRVEALAERLEGALAAARARAELTAQLDKTLADRAGLVARIEARRAEVTALAALAELTRVMSSDTYITGLHLDGDSLEIHALGGSAATVARAVEASVLFRETSLRGAVIPYDGGGDDFTLVTRLAPDGLAGGA